MNTYVDVGLEMEKNKCSSWFFRYYDIEKEKLIEQYFNYTNNLKRDILTIVLMAVKQLVNEGIKRAVFVVQHQVAQRFLKQLTKKSALKEPDLYFRELMIDIAKYKKKFEFLGYKQEIPKKETKMTRKKEIQLQTPNFYQYTAYSDMSFSVKKKKASLAGLIFDKEGNEIGSFKQKLVEVSSAKWLEMIALYKLVKKADSLGLENVLFRSDCKGSVIAISKTKKRSDPYYQKMISFIQNYLKKHPTSKIEYINRKHNKEAHKLAQNVLK